ncbi:hypothetical protein [Kumtagia ephedrae]|uniref:DUF883 domain-containing protein n=1 Tax=Kumtagia ephedrae TaxID=2116701 RepID=A0A2P7SPX7_9HYPH|nr:hypothetical protein [Mesorhizobium ephedrae]PSJ64519.1 hypothetical protein C7I84_06140 [Mesorhizobium ephedrae]
MAADDPQRMTQTESKEALEKQVAQLRREITSMKRTLAARAEQAAEQSSGWVENATDRAGRAASALKSRAQEVSGAVQENPVTYSTTALLFTAVGFMIGLAVGQSSDHRHRRWH